jgi:hypothetical protein
MNCLRQHDVLGNQYWRHWIHVRREAQQGDGRCTEPFRPAFPSIFSHHLFGHLFA